MSFYDETLKARHEDDMDDDYSDVGSFGSSSMEEDYEEEEEESIGAESAGNTAMGGGETSAPSKPAPARSSGGGGGGKKKAAKKPAVVDEAKSEKAAVDAFVDKISKAKLVDYCAKHGMESVAKLNKSEILDALIEKAVADLIDDILAKH